MATNNANESAATAKLAFSKLSRAQVIGKTHNLIEVVKAHPEYATRPDVQAAVAAWETSTNVVDQDDQDIHAHRAALVALLAKQAIDLSTWKRATKQTLAVVDLASAGSAEAIKKWGFEVRTRSVVAPSSDPPVGLRATFTHGTELVLRWSAVMGHRGYIVQSGDGTANGWSAPIQVPRARYQPAGLVPGQKVAFRVAVQRKNGLSGWSDAVIATAR
jgi:hypothetical protein